MQTGFPGSPDHLQTILPYYYLLTAVCRCFGAPALSDHGINVFSSCCLRSESNREVRV